MSERCSEQTCSDGTHEAIAGLSSANHLEEAAVAEVHHLPAAQLPYLPPCQLLSDLRQHQHIQCQSPSSVADLKASPENPAQTWAGMQPAGSENIEEATA